MKPRRSGRAAASASAATSPTRSAMREITSIRLVSYIYLNEITLFVIVFNNNNAQFRSDYMQMSLDAAANNADTEDIFKSQRLQIKYD